LINAAVAPMAMTALTLSDSLECLADLGTLGAPIGGAGMMKPTLRVTFLGPLPWRRLLPSAPSWGSGFGRAGFYWSRRSAVC
jgi:hypothetical protein